MMNDGDRFPSTNVNPAFRKHPSISYPEFFFRGIHLLQFALLFLNGVLAVLEIAHNESIKVLGRHGLSARS